jgi:hypothetical protein
MTKPVDEQQYNEAVKIVIEWKQASVSLLQRIMKVGYTRAATLIEEMEKRGAIGAYEGNKPRKVLITEAPDKPAESKEKKKPPTRPPKKETSKKTAKSEADKATAGRKSLWLSHDMPSKLELVEGWVRDGKIEEEIYKSLKVSKDTFYKWKREQGEFAEVLKRGREVSDYCVERSLFKRATGYSYVEETRETVRARDARGDFIMYTDDLGNMRYLTELVVTKAVTKHVVPDTAAAFIWLKNRKPQAWKDRQEGTPPLSGVPVFIDDIGE